MNIIRILTSFKLNILFATLLAACLGLGLLSAQEALGQPTNLTASIIESGVNLNWTSPTGQVDG